MNSPETGRRRRLDRELVERGLARSRAIAQADIAAGSVTVDDVVVTKASARVSVSQRVELERDDEPYVSRAGIKLAAALDRFSVDPRRRRCLDVGASTGGFTDCLLRRGAASVIAVDVGTDQLDRRISADRRVTNLEQTDVRTLDRQRIGGPVDLVVVDVSFISLDKVLPALADLVDTGGDVLTLVKPQFEAGREPVRRGRGVVRDPAIWRRVLTAVVGAAAELGLSLRGATVSPIRGASGNVEFMLWFRPVAERPAAHGADRRSMIATALDEAGEA